MSPEEIKAWRETLRVQATLFQNVPWERESNKRREAREGWVEWLSSGDGF